MGRFTSFRIINRLGHDTHRKARYDIEDINTKKRYFDLTIGSIKRMANADYPIIEVDGVKLRLLDWAKKLGIKSTTLRQYYRRHNYDTDAVAKLIKSHLNKLDKDDENND